jgi:hypothetical protein
MMAATHGFLSLAAVTALLPVLPAEVGAPAALAAALAGGVAPDADLLWTHRRTLHFPVLAPLVATVLATVALVTGLPALVLAAVAAGAAGLHALTDLLGGSAEREPWNPSTEHGVYNHVTGRWHRPRRLVPYSGAPEDFLLAAVAAALAALPAATSPGLDRALLVALAAAGLFTLLRRRLGGLAGLAARLLPAAWRSLWPTIRVRERDGGGTTVEIRRRR